MTKIYNFIAYATDKNLGSSYNDCMSLLNDEDWAVFIDHDAMFLEKYWYPRLTKLLEGNTQYGLFTCLTNRVGCPWQVPQGIDKNNHDIRYHRKIADEFSKKENNVIINVTNAALLSGVFLLVSKKTWDLIGGAKSGFLGVDNDLHKKCKDKNIQVGLLTNLYIYHWYRAEGDTSHLL